MTNHTIETANERRLAMPNTNPDQGMDSAVARQQQMLAVILADREAERIRSRAVQLHEYLDLLGSEVELDTGQSKYLDSLRREFFRPSSAAEEAAIQDAGGITYGIC